jgi:predicted DNA-binding protein YlxM (UPF0122 family)
MTHDDQVSFEDKFYEALFKGLPDHRSDVRENRLSFCKIAEDMGISRQAVSNWFSRRTISFQSIKRLTNLPGSTLTLEQIADAMDD